MSSILKVFNNHFIEFCEDVEQIFPENKDIKKAKAGLELLRKANPRIIVMFWKSYIVPNYGDQIEKGNLDYFLNKDYKEDLLKNQSNDTKIIDAIDKIRQPIREMSQDNKAKAVKYIQNLTKLSKMYG